MLLSLYRGLSRHASGIASRKLRQRAAAGREDPERIGERMGQASLPRPGAKLVWFHAASVGEAVSLLELLRRLRDACPETSCLVTSGTVTSARVMTERLPEGCMHQYVPVDVLPWIGRFLDHWRPELAVFTESEIWPAMLSEVHGRGIPLMLINARISERSFQRWRRMRGLARTLLGSFDAILAQDDLARAQLLRLGADPARIRVTGSLKEGAAPLPDDEKERALIAEGFSARPLWLAASTHDGEEEAAMAAHLAVRRGMPRLALILAPRHPERGDAVAKLVREAGLSVAQRTKAEPIRDDTDVYLADTLGEMGLWYRMAPVSFVGGSLVPVGGHNPFEPALLGSAVLYGPHVRNFRDAYSRLASAGAAREVRDADELGAALGETLQPERAAEMAAAGWEVVSESASVTDTVLARICGYLDCAA